MKLLTILFTWPLLFAYFISGKPAPNRQQQATIGDSIEFNYTHVESIGLSGPLKIRGSIANNSAKTIYFLSYSCDGMQDFIICDTVLFRPTRFLNCNYSIPVKIELKPQAKKEFTAHLIPRTKQATPLSLEFKLILLDREFNMDSVIRSHRFDFSGLPFIILKGVQE